MFGYQTRSRPIPRSSASGGARCGWTGSQQSRCCCAPGCSTRRRDDYWRHGSVCEDSGRHHRPRLPDRRLGGRLLQRGAAAARAADLPAQRTDRAVGAHLTRIIATPGPAIGFLQEALRWWDQWLKGIDTGIMDEPQYRLWLEEFVHAGDRLRAPPRTLDRGGRLAEPTHRTSRVDVGRPRARDDAGQLAAGDRDAAGQRRDRRRVVRLRQRRRAARRPTARRRHVRAVRQRAADRAVGDRRRRGAGMHRRFRPAGRAADRPSVRRRPGRRQPSAELRRTEPDAPRRPRNPGAPAGRAAGHSAAATERLRPRVSARPPHPPRFRPTPTGRWCGHRPRRCGWNCTRAD